MDFAGVKPEFVIKVCETLFSRTSPRSREPMMLGGVQLRLYVNSHWAGFDRYMLVGQGWALGFNLKEPDGTSECVYRAFSTEFQMTVPHVTGEREFVRDMTILSMSANDWDEEQIGPDDE